MGDSHAPARDVALAFVDCINRGDVDGLVVLMTDDHRLQILDEEPLRGRDANRRAWRGYADMCPAYTIYPCRIAVQGSQVAILGHTTGSHLGLPDEEEAKLTLIWIAEIRGQSVSRWTLVEDDPGNRDRLGLAEPAADY